MQAIRLSERKLTELDFARLHKLVPAGATPPLHELLDEAEVVPSTAIPADVVTMYAQFGVRHVGSQREQVLVLCYPPDVQPALGFISVLSPAGVAMLGLPVGALAAWTGPSGEENAVRIERILFQPEASGDYLS